VDAFYLFLLAVLFASALAFLRLCERV